MYSLSQSHTGLDLHVNGTDWKTAASYLVSETLHSPDSRHFPIKDWLSVALYSDSHSGFYPKQTGSGLIPIILKHFEEEQVAKSAKTVNRNFRDAGGHDKNQKRLGVSWALVWLTFSGQTILLSTKV